jgi:hypothetical protein
MAEAPEQTQLDAFVNTLGSSRVSGEGQAGNPNDYQRSITLLFRARKNWKGKDASEKSTKK